LNSVAYIRVSSKVQDLGMQRTAIERLAHSRGDTISTWYADKLSGKSLNRPALDRLRADARVGAFRRCYVFRLDRLTRSGIKDTLQVVEELRNAQAELVSVSDGFDLGGPAGEIILAVMAWASKIERLAINERISAARLRMEGEGRAWGRPQRVFDRDRAQELRAEGKSIRYISAALKVPRATLGRVLAGK